MAIGATARGSSGLGAPDTTIQHIIDLPLTQFTFTPLVPEIITTTIINLPLTQFNFTPLAPTILNGKLIDLPLTQFTFTPLTPTIIGSNIIPLPLTQFTFTPLTPTILRGTVIDLPLTQFTFTPLVPDIIFQSKRLERTVNVNETAEVFIILLKIEHSSLSQPILISNDPTQILPVAQVRGTISNGLEYIYLPFDFILPNQEDSSPIAKLRIDNVSREIATAIDALSSSPIFNIEIVLSTTPDIVELQLFDFGLNSVQWNSSQLIANITVESFDKEPFPSGRFNPSSFTGLFKS